MGRKSTTKQACLRTHRCLIPGVFVFLATLHILWQYKAVSSDPTPFQMNRRSDSPLNDIFDMVYVKNADRSVGRLMSVEKQLRAYNIKYKVMRATTESNIEVARMHDEYSKRPLGQLHIYPEYSDREISLGRHFIQSAGAFGYIHTMLGVLADAKTHEYRKILVLDDDIVLCDDFNNRVRAFFSKIEMDWKIVQLGASQYDWASVDEMLAMELGYYQPRLLHTYGSFAIAMDSTIFDQIITIARSWEVPFDMLPLMEIYERYIGHCFVAFPNMVIADVRNSLIRGQQDQLTISRRMKWKLHDFPFPPPRPTIGVVLQSSVFFNVSQDILNRHSIECDGPFILNLYCSTIMDGIRPIHDLAKGCNGSLEQSSEIDRKYSLTLDFMVSIQQGPTPVGIQDVEYYLQTQMDPTLPKSKLLGDIMPNGGVHVTKSLVTVIIPCRRISYLFNAVRSVLDQSYPLIEIIVIMDAELSSDDKAAIMSLQKWVGETRPGLHFCVIYHNNPPRGSAAARNTGIMQSHGEYIAFLDDDDIYLPGRIAKSVEVLENAGPQVGAVFCGFIREGNMDRAMHRFNSSDLLLKLLSVDYGSHYINTDTVTYRRQVIFEANGFDESFERHDDIEFNTRILSRYQFEPVKEFLVHVRPHPSDRHPMRLEYLVALKCQYLSRFSAMIRAFSTDVSEIIIRKHVVEVLGYSSDRSKEQKIAVEQALKECLR